MRPSIIQCFFVLLLAAASIGVAHAATPPSTLDPNFGVVGKVVHSPDASATTAGSDMALQADGKIVMVGTKKLTGSFTGIIVARYNADGTLDTTFSEDGWTTVSYGGEYEYGSCLAVQQDGKIVIAGTPSTQVSGGPPLVE